ncbi:glycoside hydrolase [Violaceomyces palustris]|uniref:Glycoside hydrolase n=1 Tax=Violaceomyces palustris TaxID=1673888 RepID=A0ACD0P394_9BASI|nr:glycoside hydrolase [Violaceomyces palustris]
MVGPRPASAQYPGSPGSPEALALAADGLRPGTPGTLRYSYADSLNTNAEKYDYPPGRDQPTPSPSHQGLLYADGGIPGERSSTYYFSKEGGAASTNVGFPVRSDQARRLTDPQIPVSKRGGLMGFIKRRPILSSLIALLIIAAIAVGAALGATMSKSSSSKDRDLSSSNNHGSSSSGTGATKTSGTATLTSSAAAPTATAKVITPFKAWDWTDSSLKVFGVSLGSWLVLERWQLEDWMVEAGGDDAWDEWSFASNLGSKAASVLTDHWNSWITESDMDTLAAAGINTIRVPIGYWAFIGTEGNEPYVTTGQLDQLAKMMEWCYDRNMYLMLDLHGMPGSQNGDQSSGHNTSSYTWFNSHNQDRSDKTLKAALDWLTASNYSSIVNGIGVVNEPQTTINWGPVDSGKLSTLTAYYERSYKTCLQYKIPMIFHHGFVSGSTLDQWRDFATNKNPQYLVFEDHPYPGWFPANSDKDQIQNTVCGYGQNAVGYPVPVLMSEWSATSDVNSTTYASQYYNMQLATYGWSAGSIFWNFKTMTSKLQILSLRDEIMRDYSFLDLVGAGIARTPSKGQSIKDFYSSLPNQACGDFQTYSWSNPSKTGASYSARKKRAEEDAQNKRRFFLKDA